MRIPADVADALLERWPVARLAALGPGGRPWLVPVVFAPAAGRIWSPVDGKPKRSDEPARVRHVRRDPRVSLLLDHYDADWARLWWLRVDAAASVCVAEGPGADPAAPSAVAALRDKYPQYAEVPLFRGAPRLLALAPAATSSWCSSAEALRELAARTRAPARPGVP